MSGPAEVIRHRLLGVMAGRFDHVVTVVDAPAGYGKSTLLRQAIDEAVAHELGRDVLVRATHADTPVSGLLHDAAAQVGDGPARPGELPLVLRDLVWTCSPEHVCIVIDDTHLLADGAGADLAALVEHLPANGHLVLCGRSTPPLPPSVLATALRLGPDELAFDADEQAAFHRLAGRPGHAHSGTGWPALLALGASADDIGQYLRDEVIAPLPADRLAALRTLALHRGIDAALVQAATGFAGSLDELLAGVPLTWAESGQIVVHDLVREAMLAGAPAADLAAARRAMAEALAGRGEWSDAIALAGDAHDTDLLVRLARAVAGELHIGVPDGRWLTTLDEVVAALPGTVAADVLGALATLTRDQPIGLGLMTAAAERARAEGDADLEALCVSRLSEAAFGMGRLPMLRSLAARLDELADAGCAAAERVRFRPRLWLQTLDGSNTVAWLDALPPSVDPAIARWISFDRVRGLAIQGHLRAALDAAEHVPAITDPLQRVQMEGFLAIQRWLLGELAADGVAGVHRLLDHAELRDAPHLFVRAAATTAIMEAGLGDPLRARQTLERGRLHLHHVAEGSLARHVVAQAEAVLAVIEGDEATATAVLRGALPPDGLAVIPSFVWALTAPTQYVLLPEVRAHIDRAATGPDHAAAITVARALVAWRDDADPAPAAALGWHTADRMRAWLTEPHLGELAVAAVHGGATHAASVVERFRHDPRGVLSRLDRPDRPLPDRMRSVLRTLPRRPRGVLAIDVLGPARLRRDGAEIRDDAWARRQRVRDLLLLLVARRSVTRAQAIGAMWPDKPERTGSANLRFTLNQLQSVLEPDRGSQDAPWYLVAEQDRLVLRDSELVVVDVDVFTGHVTAGDELDRTGDPELALAAYRRACDVYRGDFLVDASDPEWGYYEAQRLRGVFARMATRASSLALVHRELEEAEVLAQRAAAVEPLNEPAVRALAAALVAERRLGAARETLAKLDAELDAAGITPEPATQQLMRRLGP